MRLAAAFLALALVVLIPFLIWGDWFERMFSGDALQQWLASQGLAWGWLMAMLLGSLIAIAVTIWTGLSSGRWPGGGSCASLTS